jgi:ubiquinone/menaquinone biosynthesis C-methylase UbiE
MLPDWLSTPSTWNLVAPGYAAEIVPTFSRFAEDALALAQLAQGERVLDVATGPGTLALAAATGGARVSAIDFSPQMLVELEARAHKEGIAEIDVRVADARALPFESATFDAVFSMFALNLVADRAAAFREIHRVVRPSGRVVIATPGSIHRKPGFAEARDILCRALPSLDIDIDLPLSEPDDLERELATAGFRDIATRTSTRSMRSGSIATIWAMASRAGAPIVLARESMGKERWARASRRIVKELEERFGAGPYAIEIEVNLAVARP